MSHLGGDTAAPQTFLNHPIKATLADRASQNVLQQPARSGLNGSAGQIQYSAIFASEQKVPAARSSTAARNSAERRWNNELQDRYRDKPSYGRIVEAIDVTLSNEATEAELRLRGSGLAYLMRELLARDATMFDVPEELS